jgi:hypothetical protein
VDQACPAAQRIAAFGLALGQHGEWKIHHQRQRETIEVGRIPVLELDLDFRDRGPAQAAVTEGADLAAIDGELGSRPVRERERERPALELGRKAARDPVPHGLGDDFAPRR